MAKKTGKTKSQIFIEYMLNAEKLASDSYEAGKEDWGIWYYCNVCEEAIDIQPNTDAHYEITEYMYAKGWGHVSCHKKQNNNQ